MSNGNDKKLKLLLFGSVGDQISTLTSKIKALHKSKAGPFDLCFCVGSFQVPAEGTPDYDLLLELPIPVYVQDALTTTTGDESSDEIQTLIEPHLKAFPSSKANIFNVSVDSHPNVNLVVASCPKNVLMDTTAIQPLMDKLSHVSYVGCDFLLTSHWPQGMETLDPVMEQQAQLCSTYDVAEVALRARARYHVAPAHTTLNQYWQSPPFFHLAATTSTQTPQHTGRMISLGHVSKEKKVSKEHKFVHALGLVPLHHMDVQELQQSLGQGVASCPFTDASYTKDGNNNSNSNLQTNSGLSEAQARRILAEGNAPNQQRWNLPKNKKRKEPDHQDDNEQVDPTNTTIFVHGLHKDVTGRLQQASDITLLQAFQPFGCSKVRHPPNAATSSFAFLEFETHEQAKTCLETLGGSTSVSGVHLTLKWGTQGGSNNKQSQRNDPQHKRPRLTEEEAKDSSTLYFRFPKHIEMDNFTAASEQVRKWTEHTLEDALSEEGAPRITAAEEPALRVELRYTEPHAYGFLDFASHAAASMAIATLSGSTNGGIVLDSKTDDDGEEPTNEEESKSKDDDDKVKKEDAAEEASSKVKNEEETGEDSDAKKEETLDDKNVKKEEESKDKKEETSGDQKDNDNGEQGSNAQKEGGDGKKEPPKKEKLGGLALHWAHKKIEKSEPMNMVQDADCNFKFQRQHFPPDSRQDCWFCLASEGCEKHLITGVYNQCYAAMPKGPIHKGHVLIIPVAHSSQGAFMDKTVCGEIQELQKALRQHASEEYDMDLFVFERAIQTKGGYHTHVQCVPVPKRLGVKLETNLRAQAKANNMDLREIQSPDLVLSSLFNQDDDDDESGYFYCEVPMPGGKLEFKRFLYKVKSNGGDSGRRPQVPIQFGREIVAATMGKKELAHWKSCQVDKEEEAKMAQDLRASFEKYYSVDD